MKFLCVLLFFTSFAFADVSYKAEYPKGPDAVLTPGSLCDRPDAYRYPERVPYCNRDVDPSLKADIFQNYRNNGFRLDPKTRGDYKIDHLIPLCAGGSNHEDNLWPQHVSVYNQTDPLESVGCEKLKDAKIKQADLIQLIQEAKRDLTKVSSTLQYLQRL